MYHNESEGNFRLLKNEILIIEQIYATRWNICL